jgi:hypothetical protein
MARSPRTREKMDLGFGHLLINVIFAMFDGFGVPEPSL